MCAKRGQDFSVLDASTAKLEINVRSPPPVSFSVVSAARVAQMAETGGRNGNSIVERGSNDDRGFLNYWLRGSGSDRG